MKFVESLESLLYSLQVKEYDKKLSKYLKTTKKRIFKNIIAISIYLGITIISWFYLDITRFLTFSIFDLVILRTFLEFNNRVKLDNELEVNIKKGSDFYKQDFQEKMAEKSQELKKNPAEMEAIYEQKRKEIREMNDVNYNDQDVVMNKLAILIEDYYQIYEIPPYNIKETEWQALFDITYRVFKEGNHLDNYCNAMRDLIKYGLADALVNKSEFFTMQNIFNESYSTVLEHFNLSFEEAERIKTEFLNSNIINFKEILTFKLKK